MSASAAIATVRTASVSATATVTPQSEQQSMVKKVAFSSFLGNFIEWFDYASYSYFATVIALVFFPSGSHTVAMLQTFGVFALSFVLRPIGALFWGNFGDKKGRKGALAISIMFMSGASFLIGCLPSYAMIGIAAPALLLLLRMVQGFSASGEYAGAATFLGEYAPADKRGIYCSLIPASTAIGLLAGSTLATVMTSSLSSDALTAWGWRLPFLMAGPPRPGCALHSHQARRFAGLRFHDPGSTTISSPPLPPLPPTQPSPRCVSCSATTSRLS
mgnify:CR=1 FL=1